MLKEQSHLIDWQQTLPTNIARYLHNHQHLKTVHPVGLDGEERKRGDRAFYPHLYLYPFGETTTSPYHVHTKGTECCRCVLSNLLLFHFGMRIMHARTQTPIQPVVRMYL